MERIYDYPKSYDVIVVGGGGGCGDGDDQKTG